MNGLVQFQGLGASISERIDRLIASGSLAQVGTSATLPAGVPEKSIEDVEKEFKPWYRKWWVWGLVGAGVVGTGTAVYFVRRR